MHCAAEDPNANPVQIMNTSSTRIIPAAHYVIARTEPSRLGFTKLNKVLWYSDVEHYRRHGESLTGLCFYERMPQGPMSKAISSAVRQLEADGKVLERRTKVIDYTRRELVWLKEPDISCFNAEQIDILNEIMDVLCKHSAEAVSDVSHDAYWEALSDGDAMSVGAGAVVAADPSNKQLDWARQKIA
jgi:Protein of unknown function (DUF4065)